MSRAYKFEKLLSYGLVAAAKPLRNRWATAIYICFLRRWGVNFTGQPAYISTRGVDIDGTDYALITIGEGVTIASYVRVLTHDWAPFTIDKAMGLDPPQPLGRVSPVRIGDYSFVGLGSIILPGSDVGRGCLIGAGTVVRGVVPDFSIVIGNPGQIVGDSREYMARKFPQHKDEVFRNLAPAELAR